MFGIIYFPHGSKNQKWPVKDKHGVLEHSRISQKLSGLLAKGANFTYKPFPYLAHPFLGGTGMNLRLTRRFLDAHEVSRMPPIVP